MSSREGSKAKCPEICTDLQGLLRLSFEEADLEEAYQEELIEEGLPHRFRKVLALSGLCLLSCLGWGGEDWQWAARTATVLLSVYFMAYCVVLRTYPFLHSVIHGWVMLLGYVYGAIILSLTSDRWSRLVGSEGCFSSSLAEQLLANEFEVARCDVTGLMEAHCILKLGGLLSLSAFYTKMEAWLCFALLNFTVPTYTVLSWSLGSYEHEILVGVLEDSWFTNRLLNHLLLAGVLYVLGLLTIASRRELEIKDRQAFASEYLELVRKEWEQQEELQAAQRKNELETRLHALMAPSSLDLEDAHSYYVSHNNSEDSACRLGSETCGASSSCRSYRIQPLASAKHSHDGSVPGDTESPARKRYWVKRLRKSKESASTDESAVMVKTVPLPPVPEARPLEVNSRLHEKVEVTAAPKARTGHRLTVGHVKSSEVKPPNTKLVNAMCYRQSDYARIRQMAMNMREKEYGLHAFFEDCISCFPELSLFTLGNRPGEAAAMSSSGRSGEAEYQRTIGALFAVYWLMRLDIDGKEAFVYGVDNEWNARRPRKRRCSDQTSSEPPVPRPQPTGRQSVVASLARAATMDLRKSPTHENLRTPDLRKSPTLDNLRKRAQSCYEAEVPNMKAGRASQHPQAAATHARRQSVVSVIAERRAPPAKKLFSQMSPEEKRDSFMKTTNWWEYSNLVSQAGCGDDDAESIECIMAMLCLTSFHDIMKVEDLLPVVQPEHAPYCGYKAGVTIQDHDTALAYVLEHFPEVLPSFAGLPSQAKELIIFSQGKMHFNHGWFVQAEAPPGIMLSMFKQVLAAGASPRHVGFYFYHWITDLSGAEATPLAGAEKFVLKFPHDVLASFLWSMPFLTRLVDQSETEVFESYLRERWVQLDRDTPMPSGKGAIACLRLAVMAQQVPRTLEAFDMLGAVEQAYLSEELARTGIPEQFYSECAAPGGPAFLIYYGPAVMQGHCSSLEDLLAAMMILGRVLVAARKLWPLRPDAETRAVTIQVAELKSKKLDDIVGSPASDVREIWILLKQNENDGTVQLRQAADLNRLICLGHELVILDFSARSLAAPTARWSQSSSLSQQPVGLSRVQTNQTSHDAPPKLEQCVEEAPGSLSELDEEEDRASTPTTAQSRQSLNGMTLEKSRSGQETVNTVNTCECPGQASSLDPDQSPLLPGEVHALSPGVPERGDGPDDEPADLS